MSVEIMRFRNRFVSHVYLFFKDSSNVVSGSFSLRCLSTILGGKRYGMSLGGVDSNFLRSNSITSLFFTTS